MKAWFDKYGKVIPLFAGAVVLVVQQAVSDSTVTTAEQINIGLAVVGAVVTYIAPNLSGGVAKYTKAATSAAFAVLTGMTGWLVDGMTTSDWWALLIAATTAAGVLVLPSQQHPEGPTS